MNRFEPGTRPKLPADVNQLLRELDIVEDPSNNSYYVSTDERYHGYVIIISSVLLHGGNDYPQGTQLITLSVEALEHTFNAYKVGYGNTKSFFHENIVERIKDYLREQHYPVDSILRTKRLNALIEE